MSDKPISHYKEDLEQAFLELREQDIKIINSLAEIDRLKTIMSELDGAMSSIAAKAELASKMMDGDDRGRNISNAFLALRDWSNEELNRIRNESDKAGRVS